MFISNIPVYTFISNINTFAQEISGYIVYMYINLLYQFFTMREKMGIFRPKFQSYRHAS